MSEAFKAARNYPVDDAIEAVRRRASSGEEEVTLGAAAGRVLRQAVVATRDQPPFSASAMDGYAVQRSGLDLDRYPVLKVVGESLAGKRYKGVVGAHETVRIFTGAPMPDDCDTIIIQETTQAVDGGITLLPGALDSRNTYIRTAGQDFHAGKMLLKAGTRLDPWRLSLVAAAGCAKVIVSRRPKIVVLCTGDELVLPGQTPGPDQIYESASHALLALVRQWGGEASYLGVQKDDVDAIHDALQGVEADLIVTIGGASVGDYDLVKPALDRLGLRLDFVSLNLKPGKPTSFGVLANGTRVLGVPGNPSSAFAVAQLLLKPWIEASLGLCAQPRFVTAVTQGPITANGPRESYLRASLGYCEDGRLCVTPFGDQDSSLITVFARAGALIRRPSSAPAVAAGDRVEVVLLDREAVVD